MQTTEIIKEEQEGALASFWAMLGECEVKAHNENDVLLKQMVEQWYSQWNRITGSSSKPRWKRLRG